MADVPTVMRYIGRELRATRHVRRLTQGHVAGFLGISVSKVSRWERADRDLSMRQFLAWCVAMGRSPVTVLETAVKKAHAQADHCPTCGQPGPASRPEAEPQAPPVMEERR